jgi:hypothetical protein
LAANSTFQKTGPVIANRILEVVLTVLAWIVLPIQLVTTFILGVLVACSFGLLLLPLSIVWIVLASPLIGASWLCARVAFLRTPIGVLGIPWAALANTYCCLIPSMGELESRADKLLLTESWPYCWEYWLFRTGRFDLSSPEAEILGGILARVSRRDLIKQRTVNRLSRREKLDPQA